MTDDLVKRLREGDEFEQSMMAERAADRIEELESTLSLRTALHGEATYVIEKLEAKLAKAVEALEFWSRVEEPDIDRCIDLMETTLAELKNPEDSMKGEK
jgi:hypothetical protein